MHVVCAVIDADCGVFDQAVCAAVSYLLHGLQLLERFAGLILIAESNADLNLHLLPY